LSASCRREFSVQVAADEVVQPLVGVLVFGDLCPADVADHDLTVGPPEHLRARRLPGGEQVVAVVQARRDVAVGAEQQTLGDELDDQDGHGNPV
jgi:hypothetical protein